MLTFQQINNPVNVNKILEASGSKPIVTTSSPREGIDYTPSTNAYSNIMKSKISKSSNSQIQIKLPTHFDWRNVKDAKTGQPIISPPFSQLGISS
jgi:hypothetical protein